MASAPTQEPPTDVTGTPSLKLSGIIGGWWAGFLVRLVRNPKTTLVGVIGFISGMVVLAAQFGYTLGTTPNGRKGAEAIAGISALLVGILGKDS